ncbi:hypothetical protein L8T02_23925, partial [Enterobacter chengduensis]|uniref:hypothetical protein n=1 Tax=Enterobacter chengduensis TaxID=2494701 RepID=UPI00200429AA
GVFFCVVGVVCVVGIKNPYISILYKILLTALTAVLSFWVWSFGICSGSDSKYIAIYSNI